MQKKKNGVQNGWKLGTESKNQNGNLRWHLPLGVDPPPHHSLNGTNFHPFFTPLFSFAIESYLYETDFTTGPSQNYQYYVLLQLVQILTRILKTH